MAQSGALLPSLSLLTASRLLINTAHRLVYPFLPVIARGLGISLEQAGLLVSVRWAGGLATPGVSATVGSGERRKRQIFGGLGLFVAGAAVTAASGVFVGALVGFALMGIAKPSFDVAAQAYLAGSGSLQEARQGARDIRDDLCGIAAHRSAAGRMGHRWLRLDNAFLGVGRNRRRSRHRVVAGSRCRSSAS